MLLLINLQGFGIMIEIEMKMNMNKYCGRFNKN